MPTYGNKLKEFLVGDVVNLNLDQIGALKFLDHLVDVYRQVDSTPSEFVGTKAIGACFEGTYEIYTLRKVITAVGRFDQFKLSLSIEPNGENLLIVDREGEITTYQYGQYQVENLFITLLELFRNGKVNNDQPSVSEIVSIHKSIVVNITKEGVRIFSKVGDLVVDGSKVEIGVKKGDFIIHDNEKGKWVKYSN